MLSCGPNSQDVKFFAEENASKFRNRTEEIKTEFKDQLCSSYYKKCSFLKNQLWKMMISVASLSHEIIPKINNKRNVRQMRFGCIFF
jgi:hypothetical protein